MSSNEEVERVSMSRRKMVVGAGAVAAASVALPLLSSPAVAAAPASGAAHPAAGSQQVSNKVLTKDGVEIFYKD
jgi:non-heme chloroperoxidase